EKVIHYQCVVLFFREKTDYPPGILRAFRRFCKEQRIPCKVLDHYEPGTVEKSCLYVTIGDSDLWTILEDCIDQALVLGQDVGILSHNESRIKRIVHGGISTWSTDFSRMAERAASFVLEREPTQETIPTVFIDRGSF
ncbi:MAG: GntR family transcriptional regulator, partial [Bacteroidota bacterium]